MGIKENLNKLLEDGQDNLMLRFGLAQMYLNEGQADIAIKHLLKALEFDPAHSASWKLLGKAYTDTGQEKNAVETYMKGIQMAQSKGDIQASKEMTVFLKRVQKNHP